ncbi:antA/AntB antirepressor family protein [Shigella flexneri]
MKLINGLHGQGIAHPENHNQNNFAELIPVISGIIGSQPASVVSAKELHAALGVANDFSTWIKGRIEEYGFIADSDYTLFDSSNFRNQSSNNNHDGKAWETRRGGDRRSREYLLSLNMAKELAMVERNEQGRAVRRYFIHCEETLQQEAPLKAAALRKELKARITAASYFKPMCAALELVRQEQGKATQPHHYTTESNMLARIVLGGMTAKQWAQANGITGEARDHMSEEQLDHLSYLEQTNITLIELRQDYHQRKTELLRLSQRWLARRLEVVQ